MNVAMVSNKNRYSYVEVVYLRRNRAIPSGSSYRINKTEQQRTIIHKIFETNSSFQVKHSATGKV